MPGHAARRYSLMTPPRTCGAGWFPRSGRRGGAPGRLGPSQDAPNSAGSGTHPRQCHLRSVDPAAPIGMNDFRLRTQSYQPDRSHGPTTEVKMSTSVAPTIAASLVLGALIYKITDLIEYVRALFGRNRRPGTTVRMAGYRYSSVPLSASRQSSSSGRHSGPARFPSGSARCQISHPSRW
jgi:hypothetical protein